jgi:hypothetical protein
MTQPHASVPASISTRTMARELDSRSSDGILVRLLWQPTDNHVSVTVNDTKTGEAFQVEVRPGQRALDVFRHPYAYATRLLAPSPESWLDRISSSAGGWWAHPAG